MGIRINLNRDWRFHLGDMLLGAPHMSPDFMGMNDTAWRVVTLPHDWSVEHPFDPSNASGTGYLPGGTAWYRKHFELPEDVKGKRVRVTFGGVYKHARVYRASKIPAMLGMYCFSSNSAMTLFWVSSEIFFVFP